MKNTWFYETKIGRIGISEDSGKITNLFWGKMIAPPEYENRETAILREAKKQLTEYLSGKRKIFDLPLAPKGTEFEQAVWAALLTIPYGEIRTYGQIAAQIGRPKACRGVGRANGLNPIGIIIPCHRVIGANGRLTGYTGGLELKEKLLRLEGSWGQE